MAVFETFSKREKRLRNAGKQDVYQYDVLPQAFRIQVIHIWKGAIGSCRDHRAPNSAWTYIHGTLTRELGLFSLSQHAKDIAEECKNFMLAADTAGALDIIDLSFRVIDLGVRPFDVYDKSAF